MTDRPKGRAGRMVKVSERAPAFMQTAIELSEHVVHLGADEVAAVLGVRVVDLAPMCAGRVKPSRSCLQRLRALARELEG
jgi:hypothetical protein